MNGYATMRNHRGRRGGGHAGHGYKSMEMMVVDVMGLWW